MKELEEFEKEMIICVNNDDEETTHRNADNILVEYVKLNCPEANKLLKLYEEVRKFYC